MLRVAVFASGQGSNFQNLVDAAATDKLGGAIIDLLVCDKPAAPVVDRAKRSGIDTLVFEPKQYESREAYELEIIAELHKRGIELIVLAGYMRLITDVLVRPYEGRMVNIHPSLLPSFPGKDAVGQALQYGVKITGVSVHLVDGGLDSGAIIVQEAVTIDAADNRESLEAKIHAAEAVLYPAVVRAFAEGRVEIQDRLVTVGTRIVI